MGNPSNRFVITIGDTSHTEFAESLRWLHERAGLTACAAAKDCVTLLSQDPKEPALIVWLQSYPGEFGEADIAAVRGVLPSAAMVCIYGTLSDGELRTGRPLAGIPRIPWYTWSARAPHYWKSDATGRPILSNAAVDRPVVQAKPESPTSDRPHPSDRPGDQHVAAVVGVASGSREMTELMISVCQTGGHVARPIDAESSTIPPVGVAIWDDSCDARQSVVPIEVLAQRVAPAPLIAVMSFPRIDDYRRLSKHGVQFVLGKPFMIEDLLWQIELLVRADTMGRNHTVTH